jgi:hypothetical protein
MNTPQRDAVLKFVIESLKAQGITFGNDPHTLSMSQTGELRDWADAVRFKGSRNSSLGQGRLFYMHLSTLIEAKQL